MYKLTFAGTWTHDSNGALSAAGTLNYAATGWNVFLRMQGNTRGHHSLYNRKLNTTGTILQGASTDASANRFDLGYDAGADTPFHSFGNSNSSFSTGETDNRGFILSTRDDTTTGELRRNNNVIVSTIPTYTGYPSQIYYIGNRNGSLINLQGVSHAWVSVGNQLLSSTDKANFYTVIQAFQTALGRQV